MFNVSWYNGLTLLNTTLFDGRGESDGTREGEGGTIELKRVSSSCLASELEVGAPFLARDPCAFIDTRLSKTGKGVPPLCRLNRANQNNMLRSPNLAPCRAYPQTARAPD
jgi:hypothetical protein